LTQIYQSVEEIEQHWQEVKTQLPPELRTTLEPMFTTLIDRAKQVEDSVPAGQSRT
jgi:hypothetical protein